MADHRMKRRASASPEAAAAGRWSLMVLGVAATLGLALATVLGTAASRSRLAAPPLTATDCMDEKLALVREADLSGVELIAVGSSVAWRNFAPAAFGQVAPGTSAFNAGLCYLHVDQTAFWTSLVLDLWPRVHTVLFIVAPRDFENCDPADTEISNPLLTRLYLQRAVPRWAPYAVNFRWGYLARESQEIQRQRSATALFAISSSEGGWSPLRVPHEWVPPPTFDARCFEALRVFDRQLSARGVQMVVATLPVMPAWRSRFDPQLSRRTAWIARVRGELGPGTVFIDGTRLQRPDEGFADPLHLYPEHGRAYSRFLARGVASLLSQPVRDQAGNGSPGR